MLRTISRTRHATRLDTAWLELREDLTRLVGRAGAEEAIAGRAH